MKDPGGRPREYATHAQRQAAYRARKVEQNADTKQAFARLRQALRWAARFETVVTFEANVLNTQCQDADLLHGFVYLITGRTRDEALPKRAPRRG